MAKSGAEYLAQHPGWKSKTKAKARRCAANTDRTPEALFLSLNDDQLEVLDKALTDAEEVLKKFPVGKSGLKAKNLPGFVADVFEEHVRIHLATELSNIADHGHRNDDPDDVPEED
jgi:hypothetical protein